MLISLLFAAMLLIFTVLLHAEGLHIVRARMQGGGHSRRSWLVMAVWSVILLHLCEIALYAAAIWFLNEMVDAGDFSGLREFTPLDYYFYSAETFTALGSGDLTVTGGLRLVSAIEALNGLVLIAWSGAFTYWVMEHRWNGGRPN